MGRNWLASLKKFCRLNFSHSVFPSTVIGHIFACVCEVQLRLCFDNCQAITTLVRGRVTLNVETGIRFRYTAKFFSGFLTVL